MACQGSSDVPWDPAGSWPDSLSLEILQGTLSRVSNREFKLIESSRTINRRC